MMAFERVLTLDEDDFYNSLIKTPQNVKIANVGQLYESDDVENGFYFYIDFILCNTSQEQSVAFNVKMDHENKIVIPEGSKLYPLVSFVSGIGNDDIKCYKQDIDSALQDLTFKGKAQKQKGNKTWYKIIPLERAGE